MSTLSLREAAEQTGTSKSTLFRAIRAGRLSATRTEEGQFLIDASELFRVYEPKKQAGAAVRVEESTMVHHAPAPDAMALQVRNAELAAEVKALREMLEESRKHCERWAQQAERLAIAPPVTSKPRSWWPWRRRA